MGDAKQVGLAALLYSQDHEGSLPETLPQLVPNYLPDETLLPGHYLTTPGMVLKDLPPQAIILCRVVPGYTHQSPRLILVRVDNSVELGNAAPR